MKKLKLSWLFLLLGFGVLLAGTAAAQAAPAYNASYLNYDNGRQPLQLFVPNPAYSVDQTIGAGAAYTLNCAGWMVVRWNSDGFIQRALGSNTVYYTTVEEMIGVWPTMTQIVFTNATASAVHIQIEGM